MFVADFGVVDGKGSRQRGWRRAGLAGDRGAALRCVCASRALVCASLRSAASGPGFARDSASALTGKRQPLRNAASFAIFSICVVLCASQDSDLTCPVVFVPEYSGYEVEKGEIVGHRGRW